MIKRMVALLGLIFLFKIAFAHDVRLVTLVVPFSAGSAQDIFARLISEPLSQELKMQVMVVNKPGAGGTLGAAFVAQSKPDGSTYLVAASGHHLAGALYPRLPYHALRSFQAAAFIGFSEYVLIASSGLKTPDLPAFVALTKKQPGALTYASAGTGSTTHMGMASFLHQSGLDMVHLPLRGTNEVINEVLSGRVQAAMVSSLSIQAYKADPRIKLLGTSGPHRSSYLFDLPPLSAVGFPRFQWVSWAGFLAPVGSPAEQILAFSRAFSRVINDPQMKSRILQLGLDHNVMSPSQFDRFLRDDWKRSSDLISELKITLN